jgi:hypothetical protein
VNAKSDSTSRSSLSQSSATPPAPTSGSKSSGSRPSTPTTAGAASSTFDRLLELVDEREEHDPLTNRYAYLSGRIDECCHQHGLDDAESELAIGVVSLALRERRLDQRRQSRVTLNPDWRLS